VTPLRSPNRVDAQAWITAEAGGRLPRLRSQAPLVLRPTPDAVYLVSAAGGPVGGDRLDLRIEVRADATLRLRTVAASVALPAPAAETASPGKGGSGERRGEAARSGEAVSGVACLGEGGGESVLTVRASVAEGGVLEYLPEPMVVADGARHVTDIRIDLAPGAALVLRDEIILGRHAERGGACRTRLRVDYGAMPLLRHDVAVDGTDDVSLGPALLAGHLAHGTLLHAGPVPHTSIVLRTDERADTAAHANGWPIDTAIGVSMGHPSDGAPIPGGEVAVMPLAGPGVLVSALAPDSLSLRRLLDAAITSKASPRGDLANGSVPRW
jgi:urease accessory protein